MSGKPRLGSPADRPNRVQLSAADFAGILERYMAREKELRAACAAALDALTVAVECGCDDEETRAYAVENHVVLNQLRAALAATKGGEAP